MEKVTERIKNIQQQLITSNDTGSSTFVLVQDKSKDYYKTTKEDLEKLYKYQDEQDQLSSKNPFAVDTITENTMVLTLNRPKKLNVLNTWLFVNLKKRFEFYRDNDKLNLLIIRGNGEKAYCAGGDISELSTQTRAIGPIFPRYFFSKEYNLDYTAATIKKPKVAFWKGISFGGGLGISIHAEFRIVTETTIWSMPEVGIGLFPDVGGSYFLPRLKHDGIGNYIALTGEKLNGQDCLHFGIATHFVENKNLDILEQRLIKVMSEQGAHNRYQKNIELIDSVINEFAVHFKQDETTSLINNWLVLSKCFSNKHATLWDILKSLEDTNTPLTKSLVSSIRTKSPTSLRLAFNQIKYGGSMSLEEVFKMEYRLAIRSLSNNEFIEGVRATVIDKDKNPKWNPPTLELLTDDYINHYFSPLPEEFPIGNDQIYIKQ
ncbi:enoyl-CoA hydratase/isomerase domain-containing protein [Tieghemostelium lacteum]|uniref:Enoyl-CoA hydratase/isomerase domain-containing protein n=1 Tax=Tieghemostelium lacteum TaxID=361077 RepID=A0A151ZA15_TIELA|nr:enoyl-CoA hydratase/isomerase domain-containing protein [Tieghemostelium lacteum]|eukprot:KYQ90782.1 enoyl-CoA hydratase/isomerase domain-containing protein [Tieghemostelium lacteum]